MGSSSKTSIDVYKQEIARLRKEIEQSKIHKARVKANGMANRAGGVNTHTIDYGIKLKRERIAYLQKLIKHQKSK